MQPEASRKPAATECSRSSGLKTSRDTAGPQPLCILVVDDQPDQSALTVAALRGSLRGMYNLRVVECRTGMQAIDRLAAGGIDLAMLDYALPDLDGLEVLSRLKQRGLTVPVVLLTSSNERELLLEAMRRGASDFLGKDEVNRARLVQVVRTSLERAQLHADLMRGQKLAAIGTLAGGIAHEFNNILQVVLGHSQFALTRDEPERLKKALKYCHDAADKGAGIVRQLLAFARRENTTSQLRFSLDRAVQEAVQVEAEAARRDGVDLRVHVRSKPKTLGDCNQIVQVLVNLLTNARHACTAMVTTRAQLHPRIDVLLETVDGYVAQRFGRAAG